jgi:aminoglycoside 6'-N-acetyltransferase I
MPIRLATASDVEGWAALRALLWPDTSPAAHRAEIAALLARPGSEAVAFLDDGADGLRGFAEASLRRDHVNGCDTSPVAFLEGIFVRPDHRGCGLGRQLVGAVRGWARELNCAELGSDAALDNTASHAFHAAAGFEETERVVYFRLRL